MMNDDDAKNTPYLICKSYDEMRALLVLLILTWSTPASAFVSIAQHHGHDFPISLLQGSAAGTNFISDESTRHHDELLLKMIRFFGGDMVDTETNRFYYNCHPQLGQCEHVHFPIRDFAAAWDGSKAVEYLQTVDCEELARQERVDIEQLKEQLEGAIRCTISSYTSALVPNKFGSGVYLAEDMLEKTTSIGHSALYLLALCNAHRILSIDRDVDDSIKEAVDGLTRGILSQQMDGGAFSIEFNGEKNHRRGIEFFPGEAILALLSAYDMPSLLQESTRNAILPAMERAFVFYSNYYHTEDVGINYNIWQTLAFAKYHNLLDDNPQMRDKVKSYVLEMCEEICHSRSWEHQMARGQSFYINLETVEIACGLDAIAEGLRIAREYDDSTSLTQLFEMRATNALYFLEWAQSQVPEECKVGRGGLGHGGVQVFEQRLDVTGHAISALTKLRSLSVLLP